MSHSFTSLKKCYTHFSRDELEEIAIGLERGEFVREIVQKLGRSPSSVTREIRPNAPATAMPKRLADPDIRSYVESLLVNDGWTP
jgi:IS30 family transposase